MPIQDTTDTPLALAARLLGGVSALARIVGKHQSTVHERVATRGDVWADKVIAISQATGIPPHELRPDLPDTFPPPPSVDVIEGSTR